MSTTPSVVGLRDADRRPVGRLTGQSVLITGASRGIGHAIAELFGHEGADLCVVARSVEVSQEMRDAVESGGGRLMVRLLDVKDREACVAAVDATIDAFGKLDILVNCAGTYIAREFTDYTLEEFDETMQVNLYSPFHLAQTALRHMKIRQSGNIINVASTAGRWASLNQAAYNISKHGIVGMTRCIALEMASYGIRANAICPGLVETDLADQLYRDQAQLQGTTPEAVKNAVLARAATGRLLRAQDVAHLAVYLASPESDGMTGQSLVLDGGMLYL